MCCDSKKALSYTVDFIHGLAEPAKKVADLGHGLPTTGNKIRHGLPTTGNKIM